MYVLKMFLIKHAYHYYCTQFPIFFSISSSFLIKDKNILLILLESFFYYIVF